jgi:hypothetical protein
MGDGTWLPFPVSRCSIGIAEWKTGLPGGAQGQEGCWLREMEAGQERFPDWFEPGCPPSDADDASGTVYRFVHSHNPVLPDEFRSYHETGEVPNGPACERCGLSVFHKIEELRKTLRHLWNRYPKREYGQHVVKRELSASDGKIKQTRRPGHYTWWAYDGVTRDAAFEFVETVTKS